MALNLALIFMILLRSYSEQELKISSIIAIFKELEVELKALEKR